MLPLDTLPEDLLVLPPNLLPRLTLPDLLPSNLDPLGVPLPESAVPPVRPPLITGWLMLR